jgi:hypothetical protein
MELTNHPWINSTIKIESAWARQPEQKAGDMIFILSGLLKQERNKRIAYGITTRLGLRIQLSLHFGC